MNPNDSNITVKTTIEYLVINHEIITVKNEFGEERVLKTHFLSRKK